LEILIKKEIIMKQTKLILMTLILSFIMTIVTFNGCGKKDEKNFKIGAILPLTGGASYLGESVLFGMKIAFEDFNKKHKTNYELIPYDTQSKLSNVNNIYHLIRSSNNSNIVLSWMSSVASNLVEITEKDKVILLVGSAKPELTESKNLVLRFWPNAIQLADLEANFIINYLKSKRVGIFFINDDYGISLSNQISDRLKNSGIKIIFNETVASDITDYKNIILKYKNSNADLIYIAAYDKVYLYLVKPLKQYLGNVKILTDLTFCNFKTLTDFGDLSEGIYTIGTEVDNHSSKKEEVLQFRQRVKNEFKKEADFNTALGYDMAWVALESSNSTDGTSNKIKEYVTQKKNFNGMSGTIEFDKTGNAKFNLYLLQVQSKNAFEIKQ